MALGAIVETIRSWPDVDAILRIGGGSDVLDPYFMVSLDVYYRGSIPPESVRLPAFSYAGAFESNPARLKDRFLVDDIPFRVEYKSTDRFDEILTGTTDMRDNLSYALYRLQHGHPLHNRSPWIQEAKIKLMTLGDSFWQRFREYQEGRLRHCLEDLTASAIKDDRFFFQVSLGTFLEALAGSLFAVNHLFQPAARTLRKELSGLGVVPDNFLVLLDAMLDREGNSPARTVELARKSTLKVLAL